MCYNCLDHSVKNKNVPFFFENEGEVCSDQRMTAGIVQEHRLGLDRLTVTEYIKRLCAVGNDLL